MIELLVLGCQDQRPFCTGVVFMVLYRGEVREAVRPGGRRSDTGTRIV